ncbi:MAG TPA: ATP-binding protein, partial [Acidimicrobiales bacterium]|nr:ATP-binding protein [Acidimicrobiales bacterium]
MSEGGRLHGRQRELDTLEELLAGAARGHGGVVLLEGEPGIGKSRLVAELAERASVSGFGVFVGRGDEIGSLRPFGPIVDALDLRPDSDDPDAALAGRILAGDREQESSAVFPLGREARARVLDAVLGIIDRSTSQQPTLVVVDDLQWVDEDTLFVLIALARRASTLPLVVGLTTRTHPRPAPLTTARRALVDAGAELLTIAPLPREVLPSLVADLVGSNPGPRLLADAGRA